MANTSNDLTDPVQVDVNALFPLYGPTLYRFALSTAVHAYITQADLKAVVAEREDYRVQNATNVPPVIGNVTQVDLNPPLIIGDETPEGTLINVDASALLSLYGPLLRSTGARLIMTQDDLNTILAERETAQSNAITAVQDSVTQGA